MTLPPLGDDTYGTLQFEWQPTNYRDYGDGRRSARASGSGYMIQGSLPDPCPRGPHGFRFLEWEDFPVVIEFPDVANDPFFAGTERMSIDVSVSSFFYGPGAVTVAAPCTGVVTSYPASMHMYLALGTADGPIAPDINGEPFEFIFNGQEWVGHERKWFLDTYMDAAFYEEVVLGTLPRYVWVVDSGFFTGYRPTLGISVRATTEGPLPEFEPPEPVAPAVDPPPMPGCDAGGTPTTVSAGPHSAGVVPIEP